MNDRKQQIRKVLQTYTTKYTCAQMAEKLVQVQEETKTAQDWFEEQRKAMNMSDSEIMEITQELYEEAKRNGQPFFCNIKRS